MSRRPKDISQVVTDVAEELPITRSATTSRALVDNDAVRVVTFAFDTGEQLTEHTAAVPVVVQLLTGRITFTVAGQEHELQPADCVYLAPREPHSLEALEPSLLSLVMVHERPDGARSE